MIEIQNYPSKIHSAYNPILFTFSGKKDKIAILCFVPTPQNEDDEEQYTELEIEFTENLLTIDVKSCLVDLLDKNISEYTENIMVDKYQSIQYKIKLKTENSDGSYTLKETGSPIFTVTRSVSQIQESHSLPPGCLLTGFQKLNVWQDYPRCVSIMSNSTDIWKNQEQIPNKINRLKLDCSDTTAPAFQNKCILQWDEFVCQNEPPKAVFHFRDGENIDFLEVEFSPNQRSEAVDVISLIGAKMQGFRNTMGKPSWLDVGVNEGAFYYNIEMYAKGTGTEPGFMLFEQNDTGKLIHIVVSRVPMLANVVLEILETDNITALYKIQVELPEGIDWVNGEPPFIPFPLRLSLRAVDLDGAFDSVILTPKYSWEPQTGHAMGHWEMNRIWTLETRMRYPTSHLLLEWVFPKNEHEGGWHDVDIQRTLWRGELYNFTGLNIGTKDIPRG